MNYTPKTIPATEAKTRFGYLIEQAQRAPINITKQGRRCAVILSPEDYDELINNQIKDVMSKASKQAKKNGLSEAKLSKILKDIDNE